MIKDFLKKAARTNLGVARFAAMEVKERFAYNAPTSTQPPNQEAHQSELNEQVLPLVPEISAVKLFKALNSDTPPIILDCRDIHEREAGYIDCSVHIPMDDLSERYTELSPDVAIVVLCLHGMRSAEAASWLKHEKGFPDVRSLEGGIVSWYSDFDQQRIVVMRSEDH
ncbi:MAG TPA: rhodanese-like domain-containing protein [Myxococcales bacterium]|nr:rhodanese-like domain-containing protein [Myxococcales bacterium]